MYRLHRTRRLHSSLASTAVYLVLVFFPSSLHPSAGLTRSSAGRGEDGTPSAHQIAVSRNLFDWKPTSTKPPQGLSTPAARTEARSPVARSGRESFTDRRRREWSQQSSATATPSVQRPADITEETEPETEHTVETEYCPGTTGGHEREPETGLCIWCE